MTDIFGRHQTDAGRAELPRREDRDQDTQQDEENS